jgi:hypothetical protein
MPHIVDSAKVGLSLYVLGMVITAIYYARYSILSVDLVQPQAVVIGVVFAAMFVAYPVAAIFVASFVGGRIRGITTFVSLILLKDLALWLSYVPQSWALALCSALIQTLAFLTLDPIMTQRRRLVFTAAPPAIQALAALLLVLVLFASTLFGYLPAYLGGGRPVLVDVFTDKPDLLSNRFWQRHAGANKHIESYRVNLLYEANGYVYFVAESSHTMRGYAVMRVKRDQILRMDYVAPVEF